MTKQAKKPCKDGCLLPMQISGHNRFRCYDCGITWWFVDHAYKTDVPGAKLTR